MSCYSHCRSLDTAPSTLLTTCIARCRCSHLLQDHPHAPSSLFLAPSSLRITTPHHSCGDVTPVVIFRASQTPLRCFRPLQSPPSLQLHTITPALRNACVPLSQASSRVTALDECGREGSARAFNHPPPAPLTASCAIIRASFACHHQPHSAPAYTKTHAAPTNRSKTQAKSRALYPKSL